jgi:hypothetical protein
MTHNLAAMPRDENPKSSRRRANRSNEDSKTNLREVMDRALSEVDASLERSKQALAEADAALKIGSR